MNQFHQRRLRNLALLLVLVCGLFMAVQAIHAHPIGQADDAHCTLCLVAHASVILVALPVLPVLIGSIIGRPPMEALAPHITHSGHLFIRPPPANF